MSRQFFKTSCLGALAAAIFLLDCTVVQGQLLRRWRTRWNECCCYNYDSSYRYASYNAGYVNQGPESPATPVTDAATPGQYTYVADGCGGYIMPQNPMRDPHAPYPSPRELPTYGTPDEPLAEPTTPPQPAGTRQELDNDLNPGDTKSQGAGAGVFGDDRVGDNRTHVTSFPPSPHSEIDQEPRTQESRKVDPRPQDLNQTPLPAAEAKVDIKQAMSQFLASKLILCNNSLIQCAQRADSKLTDGEVKSFAQTVIQEHSALNAKLKPLAADYAAEAVIAVAATERPTANQVDRPDDRIARDPGAGQQRTLQETGFRESADRCYAELFAVAKKAHQNLEDAANQMMDEHATEELDMAFVGSQMVIHQMLVAELKAMDGAVSNELQAVLRDARGSAEQHLAKAKQIARRIKGAADRGGAPAPQ